VCLGLSSNSDADIVGGDGNIPASSGLRLGNVRIVVEDGGKLTVGMAVDAGVVGVCVGDGSAAAVEGMSTLTLEGATAEVCAATATIFACSSFRGRIVVSRSSVRDRGARRFRQFPGYPSAPACALQKSRGRYTYEH